jgi:hypothetical protein
MVDMERCMSIFGPLGAGTAGLRSIGAAAPNPSRRRAFATLEMAASRKAAVGLLALAALSGCGHARVSEKSLAALPLEAKLGLIEAENDLFIAIDAVDEMANRVLETRDEYRRSDARIREAKETLKLAGASSDKNHLEIARLSLQESKERQAWLDVWLSVQWSLLDAEKAKLELARARYEQVQAQAVKKANVVGAEKIRLADFDRRVAELEAVAKKAAERAERESQTAEKVKSRWSATRHTLAQKTGGGQGSAWVE